MSAEIFNVLPHDPQYPFTYRNAPVHDACPMIPHDAVVCVQVGTRSAENVLNNIFSQKESGVNTFLVEIDSDSAASERIARVVGPNHLAMRASLVDLGMRSNSVNQIFAFNVIGDSQSQSIDTYSRVDVHALNEVLRVLKVGSSFYIGETITPEWAAIVLSNIDFSNLSDEVSVTLYQDSEEHALTMIEFLEEVGIRKEKRVNFFGTRGINEQSGVVYKDLPGSDVRIHMFKPFVLKITKGQPRKKSA